MELTTFMTSLRKLKLNYLFCFKLSAGSNWMPLGGNSLRTGRACGVSDMMIDYWWISV
jgi:hypothetical protein